MVDAFEEQEPFQDSGRHHICLPHKDHHEKLVANDLKRFPKANRLDLDKWLLPKLSEAPNDWHKENLVTNLQAMRR